MSLTDRQSLPLVVLCLLGAAALTACAGEQPASREPAATPTGQPVPAAEDPLVAEWQLVRFQSMDDAQGTSRPDRPADYTMSLRADGTVAMQLDCNRATGSWQAEPAGDGATGTLAFGPLATTAMACPDPAMADLLAANLEYVRGFMLGDGLLHLSLMADGGIWTWRRIARVDFATEADPAVEAALLDASPDYTRATVDIDGREARYVYGRLDLNGDGTPEVIAMPLGSIFCGSGGCDLFILAATGSGYAVVSEFPVSRLPILVSDEATAGWRDIVRPESGGGAPASYVTYTFDGTTYVEGERLDGDAVPGGALVLAGGYSYDTALPLPPREP